MVGFYLAVSLLPLLGFNETEVSNLMSFRELKPTPLEISVTIANLPALSSSASQAESWMNSQLSFRSPTTKISSIVVGRDVLCNKELEPMWSSVLPCVENLYSALVKLDMVKEIELSVAFSSDCLGQSPVLKPMLRFVKESNLSYSTEQRAANSEPRVIRMKLEEKAKWRKLQVSSIAGGA